MVLSDYNVVNHSWLGHVVNNYIHSLDGIFNVEKNAFLLEYSVYLHMDDSTCDLLGVSLTLTCLKPCI